MRGFVITATFVAAGLSAGATLHAQQTPDPAAGQQARGAFMNVGFVGILNAGWSSEKDIRSLLLGDHDPGVRGFSIPNTELTVDGAVDPYFRGFANIMFKLDETGGTAVELEEAFALTTALPANLQVKAGQFFTEFGRQNTLHPHSWAFVDQPIAITTLLGPEGLRSQGARLSWLAPTPFYLETMFTVANSTDGTTFSFRSSESSEIHGGVVVDRAVEAARDMLFASRVATSFDPTATNSVLFGASAAFGPNNSGTDSETQIYGADAYWKWKSASAQQGFPFVSFQGEALYRRYGAAARASVDDPLVTLPAEILDDKGGYAQLLWGMKPRYVAGIRADVVRGDDAAVATPFRIDRFRVSPNLTWYPTEFSKLRVQYNYDDRKGIGRDHSLWLQLEFLLGAHAAHKF